MTRGKKICIVGMLFLAVTAMAGQALGRPTEGATEDAMAAFVAQYVNPFAPGTVLTGKIYIRYSILDPFDPAYGCDGDFPTNMFFQISLRNGPDNWTFFGYGGVACYTTAPEAQIEALKRFISNDVLPNIFRGTPSWEFKSITNVQEPPVGTTSFPDAVEYTLLADLKIAVKGNYRGDR